MAKTALPQASDNRRAAAASSRLDRVDRFYLLFAACCELNITFCTQVGHAGPLRPSGVHYDRNSLGFSTVTTGSDPVGDAFPKGNSLRAVRVIKPAIKLDVFAFDLRELERIAVSRVDESPVVCP